MNEGAPMMFHGGGGGFGGGGSVFGGAGPRHYSLDTLQGLAPGSAPGRGPACWRRDSRALRHNHHANKPESAFSYDSDDSSLSSNASGSNKSGEKGESSLRTGGSREWRGRGRRSPRAARRAAPDRYLAASAAYPFQIRFTPDDLLNGSEYDTLSQEIWDKFIKSQQTEDTFRNKMNLWRYLYHTIKAIFPRYGLYVVGSTMSGFGLDSSDMDLCLYVRPLDNVDARSHALLHLNYILNYMKGFDPLVCAEAELIQAKVPILKFRDARHGLHVDLNCNNVVGIRNTNLLYCFSTVDWRVRPLVALTKLWARAHNINDARQRTLSSYSLTLMVIHFLQCGAAPAVLPRGAGGGEWGARPRAANRQTLGELFLAMLRYYAHFPYESMAISVRAGQRVPVAECRAARAHKNDPHQWKLLCVEEPFDLTNTARSVYDPETFERIVDTFRLCAARLARGLRLADAWPAPADR